MARTPGPVWVEVNSDIVRAPEFVCLKDDAKAAFCMWAISYPTGDLPPLKVLASIVGKSMTKTKGIFDMLKLAGFANDIPGSTKLTLTGGWVREHKTSASRVAKYRAKLPADCNVTKGGNVTSLVTPNVTLHSGQSNAVCNATSAFHKEIPLRNPLRNTQNPPNGEFCEGARERFTLQKSQTFAKRRWPKNGAVPEEWLETAALERARQGLPPVDMAFVASKFERHYFAENNARTFSEWENKFINWTVNEKAATNGSGQGKLSQTDELRAIALGSTH